MLFSLSKFLDALIHGQLKNSKVEICSTDLKLKKFSLSKFFMHKINFTSAPATRIKFRDCVMVQLNQHNFTSTAGAVTNEGKGKINGRGDNYVPRTDK